MKDRGREQDEENEEHDGPHDDEESEAPEPALELGLGWAAKRPMVSTRTASEPFIAGCAPSPRTQVRRARAALFGERRRAAEPGGGRQEAFGRPFHDNWWQTETGGIMIANFAAMDVRPGSMGRPLPGVEAAIARKVADDRVEVVEQPDAQGEPHR
jgi:hypothetical protein